MNMIDENDLLTVDMFYGNSVADIDPDDEQVKEAIAEYRRLMELDSE